MEWEWLESCLINLVKIVSMWSVNGVDDCCKNIEDGLYD